MRGKRKPDDAVGVLTPVQALTVLAWREGRKLSCNFGAFGLSEDIGEPDPNSPGVERCIDLTRSRMISLARAQVSSSARMEVLRMKAPRTRSGRPYLLSRVSLIAASDFLREEAERSTATFRTIDPLKPVRPACSEPIAIMR